VSSKSREVRCAACGSLLAKLQGAALVIQRGDLQATVVGQSQVDLICYRRKCGRPTVVHLAPPELIRNAAAPSE
jgi:hypothetical protein